MVFIKLQKQFICIFDFRLGHLRVKFLIININFNGCGKIIGFAYDTVIFYEDNNWHTLKIKVESGFENIK